MRKLIKVQRGGRTKHDQNIKKKQKNNKTNKTKPYRTWIDIASGFFDRWNPVAPAESSFTEQQKCLLQELLKSFGVAIGHEFAAQLGRIVDRYDEEICSLKRAVANVDLRGVAVDDAESNQGKAATRITSLEQVANKEVSSLDVNVAAPSLEAARLTSTRARRARRKRAREAYTYDREKLLLERVEQTADTKIVNYAESQNCKQICCFSGNRWRLWK